MERKSKEETNLEAVFTKYSFQQMDAVEYAKKEMVDKIYKE